MDRTDCACSRKAYTRKTKKYNGKTYYYVVLIRVCVAQCLDIRQTVRHMGAPKGRARKGKKNCQKAMEKGPERLDKKRKAIRGTHRIETAYSIGGNRKAVREKDGQIFSCALQADMDDKINYLAKSR